VYKARDSRLGRLVAIKVIPLASLESSARKARFIQEAKAASALNHPNIVKIHDIANKDGADYIGTDVKALLQQPLSGTC